MGMPIGYKNNNKKKEFQRNYQQVEKVNYIHYNADHVYWDNIWKIMQPIGERRIDAGLTSLKERYQKQLAETGKLKAFYNNENNETLENIMDLSEDNLVQLLEGIANHINDEIKTMQLDGVITKFQNSKSKISNLIQNFYKQGTDEIDNDTVKKIFNEIGSILKTIDTSTSEQFKRFSELYLFQLDSVSRRRSKFYHPNKQYGVVNFKTDNPMLQRITKALNNIPKNIKSKKKILDKKSSLTSSLSNTCMSGILGEEVVKFIVSKLDSSFDDKTKITVSVTGTEQAKGFSNTSVSKKADIITSTYKTLFTSDLCNLNAKAQKTENELTIQFMLDSSIKWYSEDKNNGEPGHIRIHSTTGNVFADLALKIFKYQYGVYNTLVFAKESGLKEEQNKENSFRILRSAVISNNLEKFLSGRGTESGINDTVVFFVVNGYFYSIMSILEAYIRNASLKERKYQYGSSGKDLVFINMGSLKESDDLNAWNGEHGKEENKDWRRALTRSGDTTRKLLLSFPVSVNLNNNILKELIQRNNIQPIS